VRQQGVRLPRAGARQTLCLLCSTGRSVASRRSGCCLTTWFESGSGSRVEVRQRGLEADEGGSEDAGNDRDGEEPDAAKA
jgi:hypothetical protein